MIETESRSYCIVQLHYHLLDYKINLHIITRLHNIMCVIHNQIAFSSQSVNRLNVKSGLMGSGPNAH